MFKIFSLCFYIVSASLSYGVYTPNPEEDEAAKILEQQQVFDSACGLGFVNNTQNDKKKIFLARGQKYSKHTH